MVYSTASLKSNDSEAPLPRPFYVGNSSGKYLPTRTLLLASFKFILVNLNISMDTSQIE
jgi:hypothetical protein